MKPALVTVLPLPTFKAPLTVIFPSSVTVPPILRLKVELIITLVSEGMSQLLIVVSVVIVTDVLEKHEDVAEASSSKGGNSNDKGDFEANCLAEIDIEYREATNRTLTIDIAKDVVLLNQEYLPRSNSGWRFRR